MQSRLLSFIGVLRGHDLQVSPAETLDAMDVAALLGYADPERLRDGLAMVLAKSTEEDAVFRRCFDRFFLRAADESDPQSDPESSPDTAGERSLGATALELAAADSATLQGLLQTPLMRDLLAADPGGLDLAIERAAAGAGVGNIELFTQKGWYTRKVLDQLGERHLREALLELEAAGDPALPVLLDQRERLRRRVRERVEREYLLHAEGRSQRFFDQMLSTTPLSRIEQVYMDRVRRLVQRMARRLAARHARRRRRHRRGRLHPPRTLRRAVSTDGVIFEPQWRRRRPDRPQLFAVCDVSGSVAAHARFLLLFLYSLQDVLPRVRSFAFSSRLGEVSALFDEHPVEAAIELVNRRYGGATDYGQSLTDFKNLAFDDINGATTVLVLGDARNNYGEAREDILRDFHDRARQLIWLNPESRRAWGTGDSEMLRYKPACHLTAECNNLRQLERAVDQLLRNAR